VTALIRRLPLLVIAAALLGIWLATGLFALISA
jgi:hypothetical protein